MKIPSGPVATRATAAAHDAGMEKRPWYPTKAAWAAAEARKLRQQAHALPLVPASDWRGIQRRMRTLAQLSAEASRYDSMAKRFSAGG